MLYCPVFDKYIVQNGCAIYSIPQNYSVRYTAQFSMNISYRMVLQFLFFPAKLFCPWSLRQLAGVKPASRQKDIRQFFRVRDSIIRNELKHDRTN